MSCVVCILLSCLDIFLVFLLSLVPSDLFRRVLFFLLFLNSFSLFVRIHSRVFPLSYHFAYCCTFLICVSSRISHRDFEFLFVFFRGTPNYHWLNSLLHRLVYLITWCCSLMYVFIRLFFQFPLWLFFQSWSLSDCKLVFFGDKILFIISLSCFLLLFVFLQLVCVCGVSIVISMWFSSVRGFFFSF